MQDKPQTPWNNMGKKTNFWGVPMNEPANSMHNFLISLSPDNQTVEEKEAIIQKIAKSTPSPATQRQCIEPGHFKQPYQTAGIEDFEHVQAQGSHKLNQPDGMLISIPIYNEYAPKDAAFIDWFSFTFSTEYYKNLTKEFKASQHLPPEQQPQIVAELQDKLIWRLSKELELILGYGITGERDRGLYSYTRSFVLGNKWGMVCIGGDSQRDTVLVSITGEGCTAAREDWESNLYDWSCQVTRFKITRVDLAYDCHDKEYSVDKAVEHYDAGQFGVGGRFPEIEQHGNWRNPNDERGRTVYVGKRTSGKCCRVYEKGKEQGDPNSDLVRIECEWRSQSRKIPEDVLIYPGSYLSGAYPALMWIHSIQRRIKTITQKAKITYEKAIEHARRQVGRLIWYMSQVEDSAETIIQKLARPGRPPERLIIPDWRDAMMPIHANTS